MEKRIFLKKEVHDKLNGKAKAEGTASNELVAKIVTEKSGKSAEKKTAVFPAKGMINAYGFLHLSNGVAEAFGVPRDKKTPVTIDFKEGNLVVSKA